MTLQPFALALKREREVRRLSQSKLAERAGFDHSYVSRLESGARTPTREAISELGKALDPTDPSLTDVLLRAAGFLPILARSNYLSPEVAPLDMALAATVDPQRRETALHSIRVITDWLSR